MSWVVVSEPAVSFLVVMGLWDLLHHYFSSEVSSVACAETHNVSFFFQIFLFAYLHELLLWEAKI